MKINSSLLLLGMVCSHGVLFADTISVNTPHTSLILSAPAGNEMKFIYYGNRLDVQDLN